MQNNRVICSRAGPVQDHRQHIWGQFCAHARQLATYLETRSGPIQDHWQCILWPVWAHTMPSVEYFGPVQGLCKSTGSTYGTRMGPYKTIGTRVWGQCWAHTRCLAASVGTSAGPMQDNRLYILRTVLGPYKMISCIF